jgi:hypothetical protein
MLYSSIKEEVQGMKRKGKSSFQAVRKLKDATEPLVAVKVSHWPQLDIRLYLLPFLQTQLYCVSPRSR